MARTKREKPRDPAWRFQTDDIGNFDELVIGHGIHLEMMDEGVLWGSIHGPETEGRQYPPEITFTMSFGKDGKVIQITIDDDGLLEA